ERYEGSDRVSAAAWAWRLARAARKVLAATGRRLPLAISLRRDAQLAGESSACRAPAPIRRNSAAALLRAIADLVLAAAANPDGAVPPRFASAHARRCSGALRSHPEVAYSWSGRDGDHPMDRKIFYDGVRNAPFPGTLTQPQVDGMNVILDEWDKRGLTELSWLAYMLATSY